MKLSLTRPIQATIRESGGDSTEASGTSSSRCVPWPAPVDRDAGAAQRVAEEERRRERRVARGAAEVAAAVDGQRRERRALVDVEPRLPAGAGAARVEERLVGEDAARHLADPGRANLARERGEARARERRVAVADEHQAPAPDRAVLLRRGRARRSRSGSPSRARPARRRRSRASRSRRARAAARRAPRRPSRRSAGRSRPRPCAPARRAARRAPAPGAWRAASRPRRRELRGRAPARRRRPADGGRSSEALFGVPLPPSSLGLGARGDRPRGPCSRARQPLIIECEATVAPETIPALLEQIDELLAEPAEEPASLARLERTLTDGYAYALALEAERWRLEQRMSELAGELSDGNQELKAKELALLSDRLASERQPALGPARRRSRACARARAPFAESARRARCGPRRPRPGCGSRSAASSGCSRCGS